MWIKQIFIRCIDEQSIRSDQISNIFIVFSIIFAFASTIIGAKSYLQSNKKSKDTTKQ